LLEHIGQRVVVILKYREAPDKWPEAKRKRRMRVLFA